MKLSVNILNYLKNLFYTKDEVDTELSSKAETSHTHNDATTSTAGFMSSSDKSKLNGIAANANNYSLPTASSSTLGGVKVGTNLSISNGVLSATDTTYGVATTSANGLMSSSDKSKLNGVATNANNYSLPTASSSTLGGIKVGSNLSISNGILSATNTTYGVATTSANGLMSSSDKSKLNGIASGATANTIDSSLSSTSTNAVQNKVINSALAGKAASSHTHHDSAYQTLSIAGGGTARTYRMNGWAIVYFDNLAPGSTDSWYTNCTLPYNNATGTSVYMPFNAGLDKIRVRVNGSNQLQSYNYSSYSGSGQVYGYIVYPTNSSLVSPSDGGIT